MYKTNSKCARYIHNIRVYYIYVLCVIWHLAMRSTYEPHILLLLLLHI